MMSRAERMAHGGAPESGTYFAPAERTPPNELTTRIAIINGSPLVTRLLDVVSGLLAVLDDARQVVAVNGAFLATLGIEDPESVLGLRPGQALHCIHAEAAPAGCGTTPYCRSCGAAVAIVGALGQEQPVERLCVMQVTGDPDNNELVFAIRAQPIVIEGRKYVLLFLQDRTREQRRAALERTFFHDVRNRLTGLLGAVELLVLEGQPSSLVDSLRRSVAYLCKEVEMQEYLMQSKSARYDPHSQPIALAQIVDDVGSYFAGKRSGHGADPGSTR